MLLGQSIMILTLILIANQEYPNEKYESGYLLLKIKDEIVFCLWRILSFFMVRNLFCILWWHSWADYIVKETAWSNNMIAHIKYIFGYETLTLKSKWNLHKMTHDCDTIVNQQTSYFIKMHNANFFLEFRLQLLSH